MLAKPPEELSTFKGHYFLLIVAVIAVTEEHPLVIDIKYPVVADGNLVGVSAKVLNHLFGSGKRLLGVDNPV